MAHEALESKLGSSLIIERSQAIHDIDTQGPFVCSCTVLREVRLHTKFLQAHFLSPNETSAFHSIEIYTQS